MKLAVSYVPLMLLHGLLAGISISAIVRLRRRPLPYSKSKLQGHILPIMGIEFGRVLGWLRGIAIVDRSRRAGCGHDAVSHGGLSRVLGLMWYRCRMGR